MTSDTFLYTSLILGTIWENCSDPQQKVIFKTLVIHLLCLLSIATLNKTDANIATELLKEQNPSLSKECTFDKKKYSGFHWSIIYFIC